MAGKPGVIYLQKDRFQLYSPFLRQIVEFRFVPEIIQDLDVINTDMLESLVKMFVGNAKIQPSDLIIILADNAYFVKDFVLPTPPKGTPPTQQPQITRETLDVMSLDFIEHVPYENVVSKTFPLKSGLRVCAVNKDFFNAIVVAFEKLGFKITTVLPGLVLGNNLSAKPVLDNSLVSAALQKSATLQKYDLLSQEVYKPVVKESSESTEIELDDLHGVDKKPDKKRLYGMVGLLGLLLIILAVVYINSTQAPPPPEPAPATANTTAPAASQPAVSVAVSEAVQEGPKIDPAEAKLLTVQLTNAAAPAISVEKLRSALGKYGFASLTTQSQPNVNTSQTIITFSLLPSTEMRTAVLKEVKSITPNVQVQEKSDASTDITILLGK